MSGASTFGVEDVVDQAAIARTEQDRVVFDIRDIAAACRNTRQTSSSNIGAIDLRSVHRFRSRRQEIAVGVAASALETTMSAAMVSPDADARLVPRRSRPGSRQHPAY